MTEIGIIAALAEALPKLEGAKKNVSNPHFKKNYADLGSVIDALEPLKGHGLWFLQISKERDNGACFETFIIHGPSNERLSMGDTFVPADRNNAQGFGSAQTYARRYGLLSAFGLATEDDDGNAAAQSPPKAKPVASGPIDDAAVARMISLCEAVGGNQAQIVCDAYKVSSLSELTASQASAAIKRLNEKLEAKAKDGANA